jgi:hypothetical protein
LVGWYPRTNSHPARVSTPDHWVDDTPRTYSHPADYRPSNTTSNKIVNIWFSTRCISGITLIK